MFVATASRSVMTRFRARLGRSLNVGRVPYGRAAIAALALMCAALGACTPNKQWRPDAGLSRDCDYATQDQVSPECRRYSIEDHGDYRIAVVEFDEQGWFRDRRQQRSLLDMLEKEGAQRDLIVTVFVHGWKHNAEFCDSNLCCLRDMMKQVAKVERQYAAQLGRKPRLPVGVYVAWRGLSTQGFDVWENLSFYDRKNTATHVALGSARELLARLRQFQEDQNLAHENGDPLKEPSGRTRLMTVGHSFGGLIVYSAIAQALVNSALAPKGQDAEHQVTAFGDVVVLLNPAFEASRFEPVFSVAQSRERYAPNQRPVFVAVTSTEDKATRVAFPLGRLFSSVLEDYSPSAKAGDDGYDFTHHDQRQADLRTIGHAQRYETHELISTAKEKKRKQPGRVDPAACGCPYAARIAHMSDVDFETEMQRRRTFLREWSDGAGGLKPLWRRDYDDAQLQHKRGNPNSPFWIVTTHTPIIEDHNAFYTPVLLGFLRELYDDILSRDVPAAPARKSAQ